MCNSRQQRNVMFASPSYKRQSRKCMKQNICEMKPKIFAFVFVFVHFKQNGQCDSLLLIEKISFIKNFVNIHNLHVTAFICWNHANAIELQKNLWLSDYPKKIVIFDDLRKSDEFFKKGSTHNLFLIDLDSCPGGYAILESANKSDFFNYPMKWLVLIKDNHEDFANIIKKYEILPASEVFVVNCNERMFKISQPYKTKAENVLIWEDYGFWSKNSGLIQHYKYKATSERRRNLHRAKLDVSLHLDDYSSTDHLEDFKYPRVDTFTKQDWGAIKSVLDYCNIDPHIIKHDIYGYYNPSNKSWDGIIQLMAKKGTQMSTTMYYTLERFEEVDFIKMVNPLEIRFILRKPSTSYVMNIFIVAFRDEVWISMGIIMMLFGVALLLVLNTETKTKSIWRQKKFTVSDVFLILLEAFGQQGSAIDPKSISSRILFVVLFMAFMFLFVAYSAYIVVLMQSTKTITTWKELADSRMEAGGVNSSYMRHYLMNPKLPIQRRIYQNKIGPDGFYNLDVGMERVRRGFFAFHTELGSAYSYVSEKFTDDEICSLQELMGFNEEHHGYVPIPKRSPYKEIFKTAFYKVDEYGLQRRQNRRYYLVPKCYQKGANFQSVGLIACYQATLILAMGILLSLLIFVLEKIVSHFT